MPAESIPTVATIAVVFFVFMAVLGVSAWWSR